MQNLARNGFTIAQVTNALNASQGSREITFRYALLDSDNNYQGDLDIVTGGTVSNNALADNVKRVAKFDIKDAGSINFLSDRIKPYCRVHVGSGYAEFPLGIFLLSTPRRKSELGTLITRQVEAYDQLQVLCDDKVTTRYTVASAANYIAAVKAVLDSAGIELQNLTPTTLTLPAAKDWAPGTAKKTIVNDLLGAINYRSLWFDENGYAMAQPYVSPQYRSSEYTYSTDSTSVIFNGAEEELDLFSIPNSWVLTVSESDRVVLSSTYTNDNPNSPTSTAPTGRDRTIVEYETTDAADQTTLDEKVARMAFEASQVYKKLEFATAVMPMHSDSDVFTVEHTALGISAKFSETAWSLELNTGGKMTHNIRQLVEI